MTWKKPIFPQALSKGYIMSNFNKRQKRELALTVSETCRELFSNYQSIPWNKMAMRDLARFKNVNNFSRDSFQQIFDEAKEVVNTDFTKLVEQCYQVRDKLLAIEKDEADDGKGTKELLTEMTEKTEWLAQQLSKELLEEHLQELHDTHLAFLNKQIESRLKQLKDGIIKIVEEIKKVVELEFDASDEGKAKKINGAFAYGYRGIQSVIKGYFTYVEKGLGNTDPETFKQDMEPLTKFSGDRSLLAFTVENEMLERDIGAFVTDEADSEDIKKHCKKILEAVRALPGKYKDTYKKEEKA